MINVRNLVKVYGKGGEPAVKGVSFDIEKGEIVGLLGPNGAGKTTIMKMLTCYMRQTEGEIKIDGKNTLDDSIEIKKLIGYLPEHTPQYEDMTVYEYLKFTAEIRGIAINEIETSIEKMVKLTSIQKMLGKKIGELSKGFRKRVGLASVLIHDPKILILDEPTSGLDPNQIMTFRKMLRHLAEKKTIILSTHILSEIEAICERVIIINNGKIVANDTLQNLINNNKEQKYVIFCIKGEDVNVIEKELSKLDGAWKIEFEKKDDKDIFRFKALTESDTIFTANLKAMAEKFKWKITYTENNSANLEEIFLKLAGTSEEEYA